MTDARFFCNNAVNCNHVSFETLMQHRWAHKDPNICRNRSRCSSLRGESLPTSGNVPIWGGSLTPCTVHQFKWKFALWSGHAKFHMNRCNKSPDSNAQIYAKRFSILRPSAILDLLWRHHIASGNSYFMSVTKVLAFEPQKGILNIHCDVC